MIENDFSSGNLSLLRKEYDKTLLEIQNIQKSLLNLLAFQINEIIDGNNFIGNFENEYLNILEKKLREFDSLSQEFFLKNNYLKKTYTRI